MGILIPDENDEQINAEVERIHAELFDEQANVDFEKLENITDDEFAEALNSMSDTIPSNEIASYEDEVPYNNEYPKSKDEWWGLYEKYKGKIFEVVFRTMIFNSPAYEKAGDATSTLTGRTILNEMEYLLEKRDRKLYCYLSAAWDMTSDNMANEYKNKNHSGWNVICDLCSQVGCLYDDDEQ